MNVYNELMSFVDSTCNNYIGSSVASVADAIEPAAVALLGVYVILWGFAHLRGLIKEPILDAMQRVIKIGLIVGIGLRLGSYNTYVTDTFFNAPQDLANALAGNTPTGGIINSLDTILARAFDIGDIFWDEGGMTNIGYYLMAFFIWGMGTVVTAYAGFLMALSKIALAIIISLGPLFIFSLLFDASKRFFEAWVAQLANYFLVVVLVVAANLFTIRLFVRAAEKAAALGSDVEIAQLLPFFVTAGVSLLVLAQIPHIAAGLAGGISLSSFGLGRLSLSLLSRSARAGYHRGKRLAGQGLRAAGQGAKYAARRPITYYRNKRRNQIEKNDRHKS